jgi:hypothetical protein
MLKETTLFVDYDDLVKMGWKYAYGRTIEMEQVWFDRPKGPNGEMIQVLNPRPFPKSITGTYGRKRLWRYKDVITYFVKWRYLEKSEGEKLLGETIDVEPVSAEDLQKEKMKAKASFSHLKKFAGRKKAS